MSLYSQNTGSSRSFCTKSNGLLHKKGNACSPSGNFCSLCFSAGYLGTSFGPTVSL